MSRHPRLAQAIRRLACLGSLLAASTAAAQSSFVVRDLRVEGLQRISEGAVYNYLPVNVGDTLDAQRVGEALRALYGSGFFDDVEFRRDGDALVVAVVERPSIQRFDIEGNRDIKTEDLEQNLRGVGLAPGRSFSRSVLDEVQQVLTNEYFNQGKYGAKVETEVIELPNNQVRVAINITEGDRARIRQINLVGNETYSDKELLKELTLRTPNLMSFWKKDDRYARQILAGDLEALTSFYMDRGFADFRIEATDVAISPDKKDIFITINLSEGERFRISEVTLSGDMVVPKEQLQALILLKPGQTFSRKLITSTGERMEFRLGQEGFSRAAIDPATIIDRENHEVTVDFRVDPGNRVYVRRIAFVGADSVNDEVFRREMRQFEGAWLSNTSLDLSERRIRRLPFVEEVAVETVPVAGSPDEVDVVLDIQEGLPGQFGGGVGFSGTQGLILNGNFTHTNFMGRGNRVSAELAAGEFSKVYSVSHSTNYATPNGIGRSVSVAFQDLEQFTRQASDFSTQSLVASLEYSWPLSEFSRVRLGTAFRGSELLVDEQFSARQALDFVNNNGNPFRPAGGNPADCGVDNRVPFETCGTRFDTLELITGWLWDSRDRTIFAGSGMRHSLSLGVTIPGSEVSYYTASYDFIKYWRLGGDWRVALRGEVAFGEPLSDSTDVPPYRLFYAGGPESVRGFRNGRLGPLDSRGNPYGGNLKTVTQLELQLPTPEQFGNSARFSLFYDIGNVFYTGSGDAVFNSCLTPDQIVQFPPAEIDYRNVNFCTADRRVDYGFDPSALRQSVGVAVQWLAPLGTFRFSYALPLNEADRREFPDGTFLPADDTENFQFTVGSTF